MKMNNKCKNCGNVVSNTFSRVYGDNDNNVFLCINCVDPDEGGRSLLRKGAAAKEETKEKFSV